MPRRKRLAYRCTLLIAAATTSCGVEAQSDSRVQADVSNQDIAEQAFTHVENERCAIDYRISDVWSSGFNAELEIMNKSEETAEGWTASLSFTNGEQVVSAWRSHLTRAGDAPVFTHASYNAVLAPGGTASFGFRGQGTPKAPTNFLLNGVSCSRANPDSTPAEPGEVTVDECSTTGECQVLYGTDADDCVDSASNQSWCSCSGIRCSQRNDRCDGILNAAETVCCALSCGSCGGSGCSARPGGTANCCAGPITASGRSCTDSTAPCLVSQGSALCTLDQPVSGLPNYNFTMHNVLTKTMQRRDFCQANR